MTDRVNALTVVLDKNIRADDVRALVEAIGWLRHVVSVTPNVADISSHVAKERVRRELGQKLLAVIHPTLPG